MGAGEEGKEMRVRLSDLRGIIEEMLDEARRKGIDWSDVDWSKSNVQIAKEKGLNITSVLYARKKLGIKPSSAKSPGRPPVTDWSKVNWSRSNNDIANEFGVTVQAVHFFRQKHAPETVRRRGPVPRSATSSSSSVRISVTAAERAFVELEASKAGLSISEFIRRRVFGPTGTVPEEGGHDDEG